MSTTDDFFSAAVTRPVAALSLLLAFAGGCDDAQESSAAAPACQGAKCDAAGDDSAEETCRQTGGQWTDDASDSYYCACSDGSEPEDGNCSASAGDCLDDAAMIQFARDRLREEEGFFDEDFTAEASVETFEDLDGDGVPEVLVYPGMQFSGAARMESLFMSQGSACAEHYAGSFGSMGMSTHVHGLETDGVSDIVVPATNSACELVETLYTFDGSRYEEFWSGTHNLCDCDPDALIQAARNESEEFAPEDFTAEGDWELIGDLDEDGILDVIVYPGLQFSGSNQLMTVFLSNGNRCPQELALETSGDFLTAAEDKRPGAVALESYQRLSSGCDLVITLFNLEGGEYTPLGERIVDICEDE